jgi:hypothetical protein
MMNANHNAEEQQRKSPIAAAVLSVIAIALIVYKVALGWTPFWLDFLVLCFAGFLFFLSKVLLDTKTKNTNETDLKE